MLNLIGRRYWYLAFSTALIFIGLVSIAVFGFRLGIDFTGGTLLVLRFGHEVGEGDIRAVLASQELAGSRIQFVGRGSEQQLYLRTGYLEEEEIGGLKAALAESIGPLEEEDMPLPASLSPEVGQEVTRGALIAVLFASLTILFFISLAFRKMANPLRYGLCAIIAMVHDVLVAVGLFSLLSRLLGWEVDRLFVTALLTVIGFSVQDTIVVFDRIRENAPRYRGQPFELLVNHSLLQTLHRSLCTQLNALFVLTALLLFGGATLKHFVSVLLIGMVSGTYSSLFNAVPLLVVWESGDIERLFGRIRRRILRAASLR